MICECSICRAKSLGIPEEAAVFQEGSDRRVLAIKSLGMPIYWYEQRCPTELITHGLPPGLIYYRVTEQGRKCVLAERPKPKKASRSEKRYQEFLDADSGLTFGQWISRKRCID